MTASNYQPKITGKTENGFVTVGLSEEEKKAYEDLQQSVKRNPGRPPKSEQNWTVVGRSAEQEGNPAT